MPHTGLKVTLPFLLTSMGLVSVQTATAQTGPATPDFFETKVRPILATNCYACHTNSQLGGLSVQYAYFGVLNDLCRAVSEESLHRRARELHAIVRRRQMCQFVQGQDGIGR